MPLYSCTVCGRVSDERRCPDHREKEQSYGPHFDRNRLLVLKRDPVCTVCNEKPSIVAHHHPFTRRRLLAMRVKDPDGLEWLVGTCLPCHGRLSAKGK